MYFSPIERKKIFSMSPISCTVVFCVIIFSWPNLVSVFWSHLNPHWRHLVLVRIGEELHHLQQVLLTDRMSLEVETEIS